MTDTTPSPGDLSGAARSDAMSGLLARNWWAVLLRGMAAVAFGLIALFMPGVTIATLVLVFAAYMLVDGVFAIVSAVRAARRHERWGLLVLEGVVDLVAGAAALLLPGAALLAFVALTAVWALVSGGLMLGSAFRLNRDHGRLWLAVGGLASVIWGALLLLFPITGLVVLTWWLGAYALVIGVSLLVLSATLRGHLAPHQAGSPTPA
ncbi:MAG: hypothetical protein JWP49_2402 [Phenylobacterium sp.]|jgi:uncharacterized membrane protein HdeD (DUF308 family)|nr:hypothetical protein [Phenylobacterium sp.]